MNDTTSIYNDPPSSAEAQSEQKLWASAFVGNNQRSVSFRFGQAVKQLRLENHISQGELARLTNLNRSYLSELERGLASISLDRAANIAHALGCKLRDLLED